jgi:flotillin
MAVKIGGTNMAVQPAWIKAQISSTIITNMFKVANANEYLVITGLGVKDIKLVKKAIIWPGQKCTKFAMTPSNYTLALNAMTIEKLEFTLPAVFTIGPEDKPESIYKYAKLLASNSEEGALHVQELVTGVVEGETRVICASLTMEEIFKDRQFFKEHVMKGILSELNQFGMTIYNANVKQLQDSPGSEYFKYLRLKSQEGAINQAKVDVAQAKLLGAIGEKQKEAEQRKNLIEIESVTVIYEQDRQIGIAKAKTELDTERTKLENNVRIAQIEAMNEAAIREAELQKDLEVKRAMVTQEKERAEQLSKTTVQMIETLATVELYKAKTEADALLYRKQKEMEARDLEFETQAKGIRMLHDAFGGNTSATLQYIMIEKGVLQELAKTNAEAVKGMEPKISVWNTGADGNSDSGKPIRDIFQTLPPLMSIINEQTGIQPPSWIGQLPKKA